VHPIAGRNLIINKSLFMLICYLNILDAFHEAASDADCLSVIYIH